MRKLICSLTLLALVSTPVYAAKDSDQKELEAAGKAIGQAALDAAKAQAKKKKPSKPAKLRRFLFIAKNRPVIFGVKMTLDGNALDEYYKEGIEKSYKYADTNSDNKLSNAEYARVPWRTTTAAGVTNRVQRSFLLSFLGGGRKKPATKKKPTAEDKKVVSKQRFKDAFAKKNPKLAIVSANTTANQSRRPLFEFADKNNDSELSEAEFASLEARLKSRDFNDDETVSHIELTMLKNPFSANQAMSVRRAAAGTGSAAIFDLSDYAKRDVAIDKIIDKFGKKGKKKDAKKALPIAGLPKQMVAKFDANKSGDLDKTELAKLLNAAPVEFVATVKQFGLSRNSNGAFRRLGNPSISVAVGKAYEKVKTSFRILLKNGPRATIRVAGAHVELDMGNRNGFGFADFYKRQFKQFDRDNNNYLDSKEAARSRGMFSTQFSRMDRNGDGKLFLEEFEGYFQQHQENAKRRATFIVSSLGKHFFPLMDVDGDGRISKREFLAFKPSQYDENNDKKIDTDELPERYKFSFGRGQMPRLGNFFFSDSVISGNQVTPRGSRTGPQWFRRLDRNLDGDLSPREFPGSEELFTKFDKNKNGLIDAKEAQALTPKRKARKRRRGKKKVAKRPAAPQSTKAKKSTKVKANKAKAKSKTKAKKTK